MEGVSKEYRGLRHIELDLEKELDQAREERKQFDSAVVRKALDEFIELIAEIAEEVSRQYRRHTISKRSNSIAPCRNKAETV